MKKNVRIISAAAAALLAVAPVVASSATAKADVTVNNATASSTVTTQTTQATPLNINVSLNATGGTTTAQEAANSVKLSVNGATINGFNSKNVTILDSKGNEVKGSDKLSANDTYKVKVTGLTLSGLTTGTNYTISGGTISGNNISSNKGTYSASDLASTFTFTSNSFQLTDSSLNGTPFFVELGKNSNTQVTSGSVSVTTNSVDAVVEAIKNKYDASISGQAPLAKVNWKDSLRDEVKSALASAGITLNSDGNTFAAPATGSFSVTVTANATNGKSVQLPITVNTATQSVDTSDYPQISIAGSSNAVAGPNQKLDVSNVPALNNIKLNSSLTASDITKALDIKVSKSNQSILSNSSVQVDLSKVNTAVVGTYPVTVSATNPNGKTTTVTFDVTVGEKGQSTKTLVTNADIYTINGNTVTKTSDPALQAGSTISIFGKKVTIKGTSYYRINSSNSNKYILASAVDGTQEKSETHTVMVTSIAYDKDGNKTGNSYKNYTSIDIVPTVFKIKGKTYYKVAGKDEYVRVTNITGNKRTLKHNAYIYWSSKRRTPHTKKMYKGQTVTTYGAAYKFKNGKKYYRIEGCRNNNKRYIKKANF